MTSTYITTQEQAMYGCTEDYLKACATTSTNFNMFLAGILSDVQECMEMGNLEKARKLTNRAKFLIFTFTDTRNETVLINYDEVTA
jgi:hypothetical protein